MFTTSSTGWITSDLFLYYCIYLIPEIQTLRMLNSDLKERRFLVISDGHPTRNNLLALLLLDSFDIDLLILLEHSTHITQPIDVCITLPLKLYIEEELQKYSLKSMEDFIRTKQLPDQKRCKVEVREMLTHIFLNALIRAAILKSIESAFEKTGFYPFNDSKAMNSKFVPVEDFNNNIPETKNTINSQLLTEKDFLNELAMKEIGRISEPDEIVDLRKLITELKENTKKEGIIISPFPIIPASIGGDKWMMVDLNK